MLEQALQEVGELRFAEGLTIGEDMLFLLELARMGKQFCRSSYQGYGYYTNEEGAMRKGFKDSYMDQIVCWQKALAYMEKELPQLAGIYPADFRNAGGGKAGHSFRKREKGKERIWG